MCSQAPRHTAHPGRLVFGISFSREKANAVAKLADSAARALPKSSRAKTKTTVRRTGTARACRYHSGCPGRVPGAFNLPLRARPVNPFKSVCLPRLSGHKGTIVLSAQSGQPQRAASPLLLGAAKWRKARPPGIILLPIRRGCPTAILQLRPPHIQTKPKEPSS